MPVLSSPSPAVVPIEPLKAFLRVTGSEEDALLAGLIRSAAELCEGFTRLALIDREVEETLPVRPGWIRLCQAPVRSISGAFTLIDGIPAALPSGDYAVDIDAAGDGWVRVASSLRQRRVTVRYNAGLGADWNGVPEPLRHGVIRMAAHLYTHRDTEGGGGPPAAVTALWLPYRRLRLS